MPSTMVTPYKGVLISKRGVILFIPVLIIVMMIFIFLPQFTKYLPTSLVCNISEQQCRTQKTPDIICQQDRERVREHKSLLEKQSDSSIDLHKVVMNMVLTGCRQLRRIGGQWFQNSNFRDGHKFICFDDIESDGNCLIYSFGLGSDLSFENDMALRGCTVHAFDHSVPVSENNSNAIYNNPIPGLHIYKVAASASSNTDLAKIRAHPDGTSNGSLYINLADALNQNGHWGQKITYLKMDIDGAELLCLPEWLSSGALQNVQQIAMEIHAHIENSPKKFADLTLSLYKQGYITIMWDPNLIVGNANQRFYPFFEILFRKTDVCVA